jgi:hypothetical protein
VQSRTNIYHERRFSRPSACQNMADKLSIIGLLDVTGQWIKSNLFATVLVIVIANVVLTRYRPGLRHVPGPFTASFSNFWKLRQVWNGNMHKQGVRIHEDYGPIVRIGPNHISVASPEAVNVIYGVKNVFPKVSISFLQLPSRKILSSHEVSTKRSIPKGRQQETF